MSPLWCSEPTHPTHAGGCPGYIAGDEASTPGWGASGKEVTKDEQVAGDPHTLLSQTSRLGPADDMIQTGLTGGPEEAQTGCSPEPASLEPPTCPTGRQKPGQVLGRS